MKKFLTAKWQDLIMANYALDPDLLQDFLPKGTALDLYEKKCFVSLVAFKFLNTKVLGLAVPGHKDFEEVNLRFYVVRKTSEEIRRGVVFIKEIVPKPLIAFTARTIYGEPYETWEMSHKDTKNTHSYIWSDSNYDNRIHAETAENLGVPVDGSHESFIIEHYWGYTKRGTNRTDEYKVEHPKWEVCRVNYAEIDIDFGKTYGKRFGFLSETEPDSILFAKGSDISVYKGEKLRIR